MSSVWKTPPRSNAMPDIVVKIIGSKHFRYLAEKPKIKQNENLEVETETTLQNPRTGNARQMSKDTPAPTDPSDHKTMDNQDDMEEGKHPANNQKPENRQELLTGTYCGRFLDGKVSNEKFPSFFLSNQTLPVIVSCLGKNEKEAPAISEQPEVSEISQSKAEHMKTPEEKLNPGNPPAETPTPKDPPSSLKIRPVSQPFLSRAMKNHSEECETWIDRFRKLENALYLCDLSNTGVLEKERARRLIHNYNLIYNLSLSPRKIDQALQRFRSGENMLLEPALRYLKEL
uniref:DUF5580 domain-containing protein n=1 Tax=Spermophilus dauricus TaxID=99837 RepID=A0A8C9Q9S8_SPEDA